MLHINTEYVLHSMFYALRGAREIQSIISFVFYRLDYRGLGLGLFGFIFICVHNAFAFAFALCVHKLDEQATVLYKYVCACSNG